MKIPVFISVRLDSSRLPGKCLLSFGNKETVLSFVIKRSRFFKLEPIITTDTESYENGLKFLMEELDVKFFIGPKENKLKRWYRAANKFKIDIFHSVDADDPFFDAERIRLSYNYLNENKKYDLIYPSLYSDSGGASEGFSINKKILRKFNLLGDDHDTSYISSILNDNKFFKMPDPIYKRAQTRLTLDYLDDYIYLNKISKRFNYNIERKIIEDFINDKGYLDNVYLNKVWKENQIQQDNTIIKNIK
jgi:spore coat polysaccharide biosynthesis protein SpsF